MTATPVAEPVTELAPSKVVTLQAYASGPATPVDIAKDAPFGWWPAVIIALAAFIDRAESTVTLGAAASLQEYFGFNDAFLGVLASAPIVASMLLVIPAGRLADRTKRKNMLVVVMCMWGICTLGAGAAVSLAMFTTFRILLGAATPLNIPPSSSLLGDFYPRKSRTKAFGILRGLENTGMPVGTLVGAVIGGLVGWRVAFLVVAVPALILAAVLWFTLREPRRGVGDEISAMVEGRAAVQNASPLGSIGAPTASMVTGPQASTVVSGHRPDHHHHDGALGNALEELGAPEYAPAALDAAPPTGANQMGTWATIRYVFKIPTVRRLVIGQTVLFSAFSGFFAFVTLFFARVYFNDELIFNAETGNQVVTGEAQAVAGILVAGLSIFAVGLGAVMAARVDDKYAPTNPSIRVKAAVIALFTGFVALAIFSFAGPLIGRLLAFLLFAGVNIFAVSNLSAAIADCLPARMRGAGFSAFQFMLAFGGALGAGIVGGVSSAFGEDLRYGFAALLIPLLIGALVVLRARGSYVADSARVLAEAGGSRAGDELPMH
jgi:MFS family permease